MKKMVKSLLAMACAGSMLSITACNEKKAKNSGITLTVWESTNGPDEFIRQAGEAYTALHPHVHIKYVNVELGDAVEQIALDGPAGKGADIFAGPHDRLGSLVTGGHVLPTGHLEDVHPRALASCVKALTKDGVMYGYPVSAETYALFYNKAFIQEKDVPESWTALKAWTQQFNASHNGKYGFVMGVGDAYYTIIFTTGNGNRLFGENGEDAAHSNINAPQAVSGMQFFQTLRDLLDVPASDLDTATVDAAFQSGNAAMHITGLWNVVPFEKAGLDFGVAPLPALPGDVNPASSFSGTRTMFVSAYTDYPEEANDFAFFLMSDEMQMLRFKITGALPAVNVQVESPYVKGFLEQLQYAFPMPSIPEMGMYWEAMNSASKNIWNGADVATELNACDAAITGK